MTAFEVNSASIHSLTLPHKPDGAFGKDVTASLAAAYIRMNVPQETAYAQVVVNGEVAATLTNSGFAQCSNAMGKTIQGLLEEEGGLCGPELAQRRAERIAQALGGSIRHAVTAQNQHEWLARPVPTWSIDYQKMEDAGYIVPQDYRNTRFRSAELAVDTIRALLEYQMRLNEA